MVPTAMGTLGGLPLKYLVGLDRSRGARRAARAAAAAATGHRAQRRRHRARLAERPALPARPLRHGSPQPDRQRLRPAVRRAGAQHRRVPDPRSEDATPRPRSMRRCATRTRPTTTTIRSVAPSPYWGRRAHLGQQGERAQSDARCARAASGTRPHPRRRQSRVLQARLRSSVGEGFSRRALGAPARGVRAETRRSTPSSTPATARTTCSSPTTTERHAVDQRRRPGGRLARHEEVRRHRRCRRVAGLVAACARHQRQRPARRWLGGAGAACRREARHAHRGRLLCGDAEPRGRLGLGLGRLSVSRRDPALRSEDAAHRDLPAAAARLRRARRRHRHAAASSGCRSAAAIWASSTGASARRR